MTGSAPLHTDKDPNLSRQSETILLLGSNPKRRAWFREALVGDYHVLEAANYEHADVLIGHVKNLDLIVGCSNSEMEASEIKKWHAHQLAVPLLVMPATEQRVSEFPTEEVMLRVRLAMEARCSSTSILIFDEDGSERKRIADLLTTAGYRVTQVANGQEALSILARDPPDLLLTEVVMPEKDGLELIQEVRKRGLRTFMVAMSRSRYSPIARLTGAHWILQKPLRTDDLIRILRKVRDH
jgi:CheY-like chemotaxis protein